MRKPYQRMDFRRENRMPTVAFLRSGTACLTSRISAAILLAAGLSIA